MGVGVVGGVDVELVGLSAPGGHDVQALSHGRRGQVGVGGVDGAALRAVGGGGVAQFDMLGHVAGWQDGDRGTRASPDGEGPVFADGLDGPFVAVLDPARLDPATARSRWLWRVTTRSPTPTLEPSARVISRFVETWPVVMRWWRARALRSATVWESAASIRLVRPAAVSVRQASKSRSSMSSRLPASTRPCRR